MAALRCLENIPSHPFQTLSITTHVNRPFRSSGSGSSPMLFPAIPNETKFLVILASEEPPTAKIAFTHPVQSPRHRQIMNHSVDYPPKVPVGVRPCAPWVKPVKFPSFFLRISRRRDEPVGFERGLDILHALHG